MTLIRYPGSKKKLVKKITFHFPDDVYLPLWMLADKQEYREPFFGAGAIGFSILEKVATCRWDAWINDIDYGLVCLWQSVLGDHKSLCDKIERFTPHIEKYEQFKSEDGNSNLDPIELGFRKFALHQMSYGGFGVKSGGPLGGRENAHNKDAPYNIYCRWEPTRHTQEVIRLHDLLKQVNGLRISCMDFSELIDDNPKVFLYLDPPYYQKGPELYKYSMSENDHHRLASLLKSTKSRWILSYDDCLEVRSLYGGWAKFYEMEIVYTSGRVKKSKRPKNKEVLIIPNNQI